MQEEPEDIGNDSFLTDEECMSEFDDLSSDRGSDFEVSEDELDPAEPDLGNCSGKAGDLGPALARDIRGSNFELQHHAQAKTSNRKLGGRAVFSDGGGEEDDEAVY
ncbi:hypothetical protein COL922a_007539 [Colletotrichum nupharicola]|nr:hypothetical protein COL922a_007539 [Colletotrichum nupharicola]